MGIFDVSTLTRLMDIMGRIYVLTHGLFVAISVVLVFGGIYAFFSQSRFGNGFLGVDPQKHGRGLGVSMFFAGVVLSVFDTFISVFTWEFARESSPLESLSIEGAADLASGAGSDIFVLAVRLGGMYLQVVGVIFVAVGIMKGATAGSIQLSGTKILFWSLVAGIGLILLGLNMTRYTGV